MMYLTYLTHALHCAAETVKYEFPDVDLLISTIKRIFINL